MDFKHKPGTDFKSIDELDEKPVAEENRALRVGINYHNRLYHVKKHRRFLMQFTKKLFQRIETLKVAFPDLKILNSSTVRVGVKLANKPEEVKEFGVKCIEENRVRKIRDDNQYT